MVDYTRDGSVAVISIDRSAAKHAIDRETAEGLREAWERFDADDEAAVGVLTGDEDTFSAGADLKKMNLEDGPEGWLGFTRLQVDKPTIAAVEGHCVAGGLEMALWCDLRVAGAGATFGCFERRFGVPLVDGGTQRLPRIVGQGRALEMILTGRPVEADEAHDWGLVNRVVDDGQALETAVDWGETIAEFPQMTVQTDRTSVYEGVGESIEKGLQIEAWHGRRALKTAFEGAEWFAGGEGRHGEGLHGSEE